MEWKPSVNEKNYLSVLTVLTWLALAGQFYIHLQSRLAPVPELLIRFFSYFTIDTNLIVAVTCTLLLVLKDGSAFKRFLSSPKTLTAITVYIVVVGIIYNTILSALWSPEGSQLWVDQALHTIIPALFLIFWIAFVPKKELRWKDMRPWLIYPLGYCVVVMLRGAASGFYPYPFLDLGELGIERVVINSLGITLLFLVLSLLFIAIGRYSAKGR
jgi:hypothetical protein